jgi:hypothetical protein
VCFTVRQTTELKEKIQGHFDERQTQTILKLREREREGQRKIKRKNGREEKREE